MTTVPAIGPLIQGSRRPAWVLTIRQANGTPLDITGATFTGVLKDRRSDHAIVCTPGSYAITTAASGIFTYSPVAADVADVGEFWWETTLTISSVPWKVKTLVIIEEDQT